MTVNKYFSTFFLIIAVVGILILSLSPSLNFHLRVDLYGQYIDHVKHFLQDKNLTALGYNEYQPVAVMFFIALSPFFVYSNYNIDWYIYGLYLANIILIIAAAFLIYALKRNFTNIFVFGLVLLTTGPIVLHRFELLVFVELLIAILLFTQRRYFWSGLLMAVAICTKIYPVIFAPYMLYIAIMNRENKYDVFRHIGGYVVGVATVLSVYCVFLGADFYKIFSDLNIHAIKPVHSESIWSTLITLIQWGTTGNHVIGGGATGIYGLREEFILLPKLFYNYFWVVTVTIYYLFIYFKKRASKHLQFEAGILYTLALIFLTTSKILTPQYLMWFSFLFCLITIPDLTKNQFRWSIQLFLILLISVVTLYIYPLNYDTLVTFYEHPDGPQIVFWATTLRNISLLALLIFSWSSYETDEEGARKIS